ncbi:sulfotransferase domain-containing protein, partial [Micromonospora sp. ATA32]|nr:sulfotransferase domain-containing protein [Micromonospora sp. ATA32]
MPEAPFRYRSPDEDSARWLDFPFRDGDIVISTRSKNGTTWMQMICALLVLGTPELPAPLARLSPWLDWLVEPRDEVFGRLAAQPHRRFIKTHTPLDGVPIDPRVSYVVVARHPLDAAVSLWHQGGNLDRVRLAELTGQPAPEYRRRRGRGRSREGALKQSTNMKSIRQRGCAEAVHQHEVDPATTG